MPDGIEVRALSDPREWYKAAADLVLNAAREAVRARGRFSFCLAGGQTPGPLYRLLAGSPWAENFPWRQTYLFWGDERAVAPDAPESNRLAAEILISRVPPGQVFPMPGTTRPLERAALEYEARLRAYFATGPDPARAGFDLILLGLGADGHTASLFPGSPVLKERERWVMAAGAPDGSPVRDRLTLTIPLLNLGRTVVFMVGGSDKAPMIARILGTEPGGEGTLPASLIRPVGRLVWLLDGQAGAGLG